MTDVFSEFALWPLLEPFARAWIHLPRVVKDKLIAAPSFSRSPLASVFATRSLKRFETVSHFQILKHGLYFPVETFKNTRSQLTVASNFNHNYFQISAVSYLPARSTKLMIDDLLMSSPASFLCFCTKVIPTIVCERLHKENNLLDKTILKTSYSVRFICLRLERTYELNCYILKLYMAYTRPIPLFAMTIHWELYTP